MKSKYRVGGVVAGPIMGLCIPWRTMAPPTPDAMHLRVVTCNLHGSESVDPDGLEALIQESRAEVVALQEWPEAEITSLGTWPGWHRPGARFGLHGLAVAVVLGAAVVAGVYVVPAVTRTHLTAQRESDGSRNGSPGMKCCAFIHTNDKQKLGAELSAYMMRRQSKSPDSFTVQLIEHRDHPFLAAHEGQSYLRNGQQQPWLNDDLQSFTPLRFLPPELMGFEGRALVSRVLLHDSPLHARIACWFDMAFFTRFPTTGIPLSGWRVSLKTASGYFARSSRRSVGFFGKEWEATATVMETFVRSPCKGDPGSMDTSSSEWSFHVSPGDVLVLLLA